MAIIDILTHYDAKKKAAHAAKTVKHGVSISLCFCLSSWVDAVHRARPSSGQLLPTELFAHSSPCHLQSARSDSRRRTRRCRPLAPALTENLRALADHLRSASALLFTHQGY